jgi:hypothetical protein
LRFYDILGKEVGTLVNTNLTAGIYRTLFNAKGLASGIYIYQIIAIPSDSNIKSFINSKKLIIMK